MSERPVVIVIAAGPGISGSLARRYAREGYDAGLVGVDEPVLQTLADELDRARRKRPPRRRRHHRRGRGHRRDPRPGRAASAGSTGCTSTPVRSARSTR